MQIVVHEAALHLRPLAPSPPPPIMIISGGSSDILETSKFPIALSQSVQIHETNPPHTPKIPPT
jgi:hypothetical protein